MEVIRHVNEAGLRIPLYLRGDQSHHLQGGGDICDGRITGRTACLSQSAMAISTRWMLRCGWLFILSVSHARALTKTAATASVSSLLLAGCREAANCRYCFYSQAKNQVFRPAGATRCTDSGQTLQDRRAPGSAWLCKISRPSVRRGGNAAPKISKISTFW